VENQELILSITQLFLKYGIKSVTMDDIARDLGMSKKTLYKHFPDKKELVKKVLEGFVEYDKAYICILVKKDLNAIDKMLEIEKYVTEKVKEVHPSIHYDLQKYYPEAWKIFINHKTGFIYNCIIDNMKAGVKEGLYRNDLDMEILGRLYISRIDLFINPEVFPPDQFSFKRTLTEAILYHLRGIASEKGIEYLKKINIRKVLK
jgi:TetR/AcrR family transcriptional regulator, cholesterol catabolism regulator